ncbi:MAG: hypothetical protein SFU98_12760 [Leptospiraceae bacterium]|nr:hypothetical protein [Leptospiraceae bacterium]
MKLIAIYLLSMILFFGNCQEKKKPNTTAFLLVLVSLYTYPQNRVFQDLGTAINETIRLLYNRSIAGTIGSTVNVSGACSLGGTYTITGTAVPSSGNTTTNLTYVLNGCKERYTSGSLTSEVALTGSIVQSGTVGAVTNYTRTSSSLVLKGTQANTFYSFGTPASIDRTCPVSITVTDTLFSSTVCGINYSF